MAISLILFCGSPNAHDGAAAGLDCTRTPNNNRGCLEPVSWFSNRGPSDRRAGAVQGRYRTNNSPRAGENLEHVDVALIDRAEHEIDMAALQLPTNVMRIMANESGLKTHSIKLTL